MIKNKKTGVLSKSPIEQRVETRLSGNLHVYVEVCAEGPDDLPELIEGKVIDFSANGVQLLLSSPLPETALITLYFLTPDMADPYRLIAEVRWCRPAKALEQHFQIGFFFYESDDSQIAHWKLLVAKWLDAG